MNDSLNEREFELVNIIGSLLAPSQRDLSKKLNLSLGKTNILIHRLISKGYIRIRQLNKRKVEYLLTPKGFSEKFQKSIKYTIKTIQSITLVEERIRSILKDLYSKNIKQIYIFGRSGLVPLVESTFKDTAPAGVQLQTIQNIQDYKAKEGIVLICQEKVPENCEGVSFIHLIEALAKEVSFLEDYKVGI